MKNPSEFEMDERCINILEMFIEEEMEFERMTF